MASSSSSSSNFRQVKPSERIKAAVIERQRENEASNKVSAWLSKSQFRPEQKSSKSTVSALNETNKSVSSKGPYSRKEEESIIRDIVQNHAYNQLKGE